MTAEEEEEERRTKSRSHQQHSTPGSVEINSSISIIPWRSTAAIGSEGGTITDIRFQSIKIYTDL